MHCPAPCLGYSFINQNPVLPDLLDRLPVTLSLAAGAAVLWLVGGVIYRRASRRCGGAACSTGRRWASRSRASRCRSSSPGCYRWRSSATRWASPLPGGSYTPFEVNPLLWAYDLLLPWITLAFLYAAGYARLTRAGMLDTMGEDFIRTARAKGLPERTVVVKHGLRSALTPILTIFGLDLGLLLGGAILTESTYSLPGIGKYSVDAIVNNDLPKVLGVVLLGSIFIVVANLVVDLLVRRDRPEGEVGVSRVDVSCRGGAMSEDVLAGGAPTAAREAVVPGRARPARALPHRRRRRQVGRRPVVPPGTGQAARHRGGVGLRQERDQPGDHGAAQGGRGGDLRRDLVGRHRARVGRPGDRAQAARQDDGDDLPGPAVGDAPVLHGGRADRRGVPAAPRRQQEGGAQAGGGTARPRRDPAAADAGSTTTRTSSPAACGSAR